MKNIILNSVATTAIIISFFVIAFLVFTSQCNQGRKLKDAYSTFLQGEGEQIEDSTDAKIAAIIKEEIGKLKKGGSVSAVTSRTTVSAGARTVVDFPDTILVDSTVTVFPRYTFDVDLNGWVKVKGSADKDTTMFNLDIRNEYEVVIGSKRKGLFKREPYADIAALNPYTKAETRTFSVSAPPPKRFGVGVNGGIVLGADGKIRPAIGVGVNYNLIEFGRNTPKIEKVKKPKKKRRNK